MFEAIRDILKAIRDLEERTTREYLDLARKTKSAELKSTLYSLLAEKLIHTEVIRGLLRAYDRLEDLAWEFQQKISPIKGEEDEKEWRRMQLKLEELQALQERLAKLLDLYVDEMDRQVTREILEAVLKNEKNVVNELEALLTDIREKIKEFLLRESERKKA